MKRPSYALSVPVTVAGLAAVLALTGVGFVPVQAAVTAPVDCPRPFPTAEAVDGVAGTGFTVETGTTREPFTAEVVGRIDDGIAPGIDMIMARVSSPAITRAGGIWAGMSGSPIYAPDGRLIGALAYGLAANTHYAGITPAESMFPLLGTAPRTRAAGSRTGASRVAVPPAAARQLAARGVVVRAGDGGFTRLELPVSLSGGGEAIERRITDKFLGAIPDVRVVTGGNRAPAKAAPPATIQAGGNFVAALSYGAVTAAAVGTTTFVCDGRAVAFGHPFLYQGPKTYSAHSASALFVQPNTDGYPFKVANVGGVVGTVDRDFTAGIGARLGAGPRTALITSNLSRVGGGRAATVTSRVPNEEFTPTAVGLHILRGVQTALGGESKGSATMSVKITGVRANGRPFTLTLSDRYTHSRILAFALAEQTYFQLEALDAKQEFENVRITSVDVKGTVEPVIREYRVAGVTVKKGSRYVSPEQATWSPGSTVKVRVAMTSYKNLLGRRTVDLALKVPRSMPREGVSLVVDAGSEFKTGHLTATSFDGLLKELQTSGHGSSIRVTLQRLTDSGEVVPGRAPLASVKASAPASIRVYQLVAALNQAGPRKR